MKKVLSLLLIGVLSFSLVGCGDDTEDKKESTPKTEEKEEKKELTVKEIKKKFEDKGYEDFNGNYRLMESSGNYILFTFYKDEATCSLDVTENGVSTVYYYNEDWGWTGTAKYDFATNSFREGANGTDEELTRIKKAKETFEKSLKDLGLTIDDLNNYSANK